LETLKSYNPSEKGRELIAVLFPLAHSEREKNIFAFWKRYPHELNAVVDGFHYLIQELVEARGTGNTEENLKLPDDLLFAIFKQMIKEKIFFSYDNDSDFFDAVSKIQPSVFADNAKLNILFKNAAVVQKDQKTLSTGGSEIGASLKKNINETCLTAAKSYEEVVRIGPSVRRAKKVIDELQGTKDQLEMIDLNLAKETYSESIEIFRKHAKAIADGLELISEAYQKHNDKIIILQIYSKYLAKVLASRESFHPTERYVLQMAGGQFAHEEPGFAPSDEQLQQGITSVKLRKEYKNKLVKLTNRLECRYHKRKLMVQMKEGAPKLEIIKHLIRAAEMDQEDVKTSILLARLLAEHLKTLRDPKKRRYAREEALRYCKFAFSKIDVYLNLQGYKNVRERDVQRAGLVKTISAIRLPLIKRGK